MGVAASSSMGKGILFVPAAGLLLVAACGPGWGDYGGMGNLQSLVSNLQKMQKEEGTVGGTLASGKDGAPQWTFAGEACEAGQPQGFFGVDIARSKDDTAVVRLVKDPIDGPRVRIERLVDGAPQAVVLDRAHCAALDLNVQEAGIAYNHVWALEGSATIDCSVDGTSYAGTLKFANCHQSPTVDAVNTQLTPAPGGPVASMARVPAEPPPVPLLPTELAALTVSVRPRIVGLVVGDDTTEHARAVCQESSETFLRKLGWNVVAEGASAPLVAEVSCTGHVDFRDTPAGLEIILPNEPAPSVVLFAGDRAVVTVPAGPRAMLCASTLTGAAREKDCGARAGAAGEARIASALAASDELRAYVSSRDTRPRQ
jgi:hypothetical protein